MKRELQLNGQKVSVEVHRKTPQSVSLNWQGQEITFEIVARHARQLVLRDQAGLMHRLQIDGNGVVGNGLDAEFSTTAPTAKGSAKGGSDMSAPMPGKVFKVLVAAGDKVQTGQTIMILEAMKMEHAIKAPKEGIVKKLFFKEGDLVQGGKPLAELE